jgi:hypothetical protein
LSSFNEKTPNRVTVQSVLRRTLPALILATTLGFVAGCNSSEPAGMGSGGDPLARPLQLPTEGAGGRCPIESGRTVDPAYGPAVGKGPVYAAALGTDSTLPFSPPERFESKSWGGNKVLWLVAPAYRGPVLIRGRRLDRPGLVRFDEGDVPPARIRLGGDPVSQGSDPLWRERSSYTRIEGLGCYAYQVDGRDFTYPIVFRAVAASD